jgi:hypothetical protein
MHPPLRNVTAVRRGKAGSAGDVLGLAILDLDCGHLALWRERHRDPKSALCFSCPKVEAP